MSIIPLAFLRAIPSNLGENNNITLFDLSNNRLSGNISMYKNSNNTIRITGLNLEENVIVKMYSVTGKEVLVKQFVAENIKDIALPTLATGVYVVNIIANNRELNKKLIIE